MAGGYRTSQGVMDEVAAERDPAVKKTQTYYDPSADENSHSSSSGLASFMEGIGAASGYRSPGYQVNQGVTQYGNSPDAAQNNLNALGQRAADYGQDYSVASAQNQGARQMQLGAYGNMQNAYGQMAGLANGTGPSLAQQQMYQGLQQSQAAAASRAASARGGGANMAAAQLAAQQQQAQLASQANQQAAMLRSQEQMQAIQGLGGLASAQGNLAGNVRQGDLSGQQIGLQGQSLYDRMAQEQLQNEMNARAQLEATQGQLAIQHQQQLAQQNQSSAEQGGSMFKGILGGLSSMFSMSDERTKTDKRDASGDIDAKLDRIRAMAYRYNDEPKGTERIGPMAQDLPSETIAEVGGLKVVRMPEAMGFGLAALARLNERVRKLEKK